MLTVIVFFFFFQAEDGIRDRDVTGVQTCALPIYRGYPAPAEGVESASSCRQRQELADSTPSAGAGYPRLPRPLRQLLRTEIGRASCRERVLNTVVAGVYKQKYINNT